MTDNLRELTDDEAARVLADYMMSGEYTVYVASMSFGEAPMKPEDAMMFRWRGKLFAIRRTVR